MILQDQYDQTKLYNYTLTYIDSNKNRQFEDIFKADWLEVKEIVRITIRDGSTNVHILVRMLPATFRLDLAYQNNRKDINS